MKTTMLSLVFCLAATPALADMTYGAIAVSGETGAWGRSYDWSTQAIAESEALKACAKDGATDCKVATWVRGQYCAAVAVKHYDDGTIAWGSFSATRLTDARAGALTECAKYTSNNEACDEVISDVCGQN